jgi:glycosyltransferase involved in cell wall biosynthesis
METPFISVVITVLNMDRTVAGCLDSILEIDYPKDRYEIVIVDGGSRDRTAGIIKKYIEKTKEPRISLYLRKGWPSAGRNEALRHARGDYIAVTDADMVVTRNWLKDYVGAMEKLKDDKIAGIGGPNITATLDLASRSISCIPVHGPTSDEVPVFGKNRYTKDFVTSDFIYATVCRNSFYKKKVLDEVGGFDERFFGAEDPELNRRILDAGYKLAYTKKALVRHHHHNTVRSFFRQQMKYSLWQAVANRLHPKMGSILHPVPFIAALAFIGLLLLPVLYHPFIYLLAAGILAVIIALLGYGLKCAVIKRDSALFVSVPFYTLIWQFAWIFGYPAGVLQRGKLLAAGPPPTPGRIPAGNGLNNVRGAHEK